MVALSLNPKYEVDAQLYASQGNAILGIRDAGKTYTAMKAAEQLLENDVPIVVYDPVGVWKNLKIGVGKHKGYPVVIAGGEDADIRLTAANAVDIVRAAMKENVSIVFDLYSPELINKSTWIRIVQETVDVLMYENKSFSLRHIFLEEAAEFIPQRLQPQHSRVYASLERLARMGRNARLGITLINQRAEEVNKAILEICNFSLLHKQVGKNSLKSIQQWLDLRQLEKVSDIIKSLPGLKQGECWAIGLSDQPKLIKIAPRNTFHPDPRAHNVTDAKKQPTADVRLFVEKMNKQLTKETKPTISLLSKTHVNHLEKLQKDNELLKAACNNAVEQQKNTAKELLLSKQLVAYYEKTNAFIKENLNELIAKYLNKEPPVKINELRKGEPVKPVSQSFTDHNRAFASKVYNKANTAAKKLGKCSTVILQFLAQYNDRSFSKTQVGIASGYSPNSGGFNNALSELSSNRLISKVEGRLMINDVHNLEEWTGRPIETKQYDIETYKDKLNKCEREIYEVLLQQPKRAFMKEELAGETSSQYSYTSGGFNNALSTLNTLELIKRENGLIKLNPELINFL